MALQRSTSASGSSTQLPVVPMACTCCSECYL
jgi:hypothetical protein